jgi:hypothetical protein
MNMKKPLIIIIIILLVLLAIGFLWFTAVPNSGPVVAPLPPAAETWDGKWLRENSGNAESSELTITKAAEGYFQFTLATFSGSHMGNVEGKARINGSEAVFSDTEDCLGCVIRFRLKQQVVTVETNEPCSCFAGVGVVFDGRYFRPEKLPKPDLSLAGQGVLPDKAAEKEFQKLTGADYEQFRGSFHLINEEEDRDGFGAKVYSGRVRGLSGAMESIIMHQPKGVLFWAAVITDEDGIHYYSNDPEYRQRLPETIKEWWGRFPHLKLKYMN